jgi:hypothetical protein
VSQWSTHCPAQSGTAEDGVEAERAIGLDLLLGEELVPGFGGFEFWG